ncbi:hypothetical protein HN51_012828 [Arachis hypogaea]|uniref:NAC domain-containing protein n=1 Tax=Arachis hypogaea TaxID=3818 RepID=A0A445DSP2_ARAHY|nr:NAC domain-containing protein 104-like [Arachis hypogaea]QHO58419.1 NAC domain-containing protein [Arachis hypogaea]RYR66195.1 hypothetical protein Ahy_A03g012167 [Arachis hypogaea]
MTNLPPGFCFSPTDEELILHFLYSRISLPFHPSIIPDLDPSQLHPCQLNGKAFSSGNQHYFFTNKVKENRSTENGYWKEIGLSEPIISADANKKLGIKKYFVFTLNEGTETNWVMQEYHISSSMFHNPISCYANGTAHRRLLRPDQNQNNKWVLCRVYEKNKSQSQQGATANSYYSDEDDCGSELSYLDEVYLSLDDDLEVISPPN